jgi:hypothetical protein
MRTSPGTLASADQTTLAIERQRNEDPAISAADALAAGRARMQKNQLPDARWPNIMAGMDH